MLLILVLNNEIVQNLRDSFVAFVTSRGFAEFCESILSYVSDYRFTFVGAFIIYTVVCVINIGLFVFNYENTLNINVLAAIEFQAIRSAVADGSNRYNIRLRCNLSSVAFDGFLLYSIYLADYALSGVSVPAEFLPNRILTTALFSAILFLFNNILAEASVVRFLDRVVRAQISRRFNLNRITFDLGIGLATSRNGFISPLAIGLVLSALLVIILFPGIFDYGILGVFFAEARGFLSNFSISGRTTPALVRECFGLIIGFVSISVVLIFLAVCFSVTVFYCLFNVTNTRRRSSRR